MNNTIKAIVGAAALGVAMTSGIFIGQAMADQPYMQTALTALVTARDNLAMAEHNKAGHRREALRLTNAAIDEVRAGMASAD